MTQETRETLTKMLERGGVDCGRPCAEFYPEEIAALRDVLTPRTCGTCRHWKRAWPNVAGSVTGECQNRRAMPWHNVALRVAYGPYEWTRLTPSDDGCIKGWARRKQLEAEAMARGEV